MNFADELTYLKFNFTLIYSMASFLCILVLLFVAFKEKFSSIYTIARVYSIKVTIFGSLLIFFNGLWRWLDSGFMPVNLPLLKAVDTIYFCIDAAIYLNMYLYFEYQLGYIYSKKQKFILSIPFIITIIIELVNFKFPFLYHFEWDQTRGVYIYTRDKLFLLGSIVPYGYIVGLSTIRMLLFIIDKSKKKDVEIGSLPYIMILSYSIALSAYFNPRIQNIPLYPTVFSFGFFLFYFHEIGNQMSLDPLTKLSNRREFGFTLKRQINLLKHNDSYNLYLVLIDANDFKQINDKFGHDIGDQTLVGIGEGIKKVLANCRENKTSTFRLGGDEFALILHAREDSQVRNIMEEINQSIQEITARESPDHKISISYGFCKYEPGTDRMDFMKKTDVELYKNKRNYHKQIN